MPLKRSQVKILNTNIQLVIYKNRTRKSTYDWYGNKSSSSRWNASTYVRRRSASARRTSDVVRGYVLYGLTVLSYQLDIHRVKVT